MNLIKTIVLIAAGASLAGAASIQFVGVPTGVNDGTYYVTPYQITIDGVGQLVTCYDTHDDVNFGDMWNANLLTLNSAAVSGYFASSLAGYERVAWLDAQTYTDNSQQVGLQHAIWNVFGSAPGSDTSYTLAYEASADAAAATGYSGFDFSRFRFIEQVGGVPGQNGTEQAFVFEEPAGSLNSAASAATVAEPGSTLTLGIGGVLLVGLSYCRRRRGFWSWSC